MITVTDRAVAVLKTFCTDDIRGIRVAVAAGGCSGLKYSMALETAPAEGDEVLERDGVAVYIDPPSVMWLAGATMDFVEGESGPGFVFDNPTAAGKCSCSGGTC